jgi:Flp pilus assembly protein TadG
VIMGLKNKGATFRQPAWLRQLTDAKGQSLVELAVLTPIILVLLVGIIEVGRFAYLSILVSNAARAGVQYGAQNLATASDVAGIEAAAMNDVQNIPGLSFPSAPRYYCSCASAPNVPTSCPAVCGGGDHGLVYVQVQTKGVFTSLFRYPGLPATFTTNGNAVMRVAQ